MPSTFADELVALLPRLKRFGVSLTGSASEAEDLVQAACERALRARDQWMDGTRLDAWVFRIMRNLWIDTIRKRATQGPHDTLDEVGEVSVEDGRRVTEAALTLNAVDQAIAEMTDEQRSVLILICVEERSYQEAASMLGIPIGTVMSRLARAAGPRAQPASRPKDACGWRDRGKQTMKQPEIPDEVLVALADGELPEAEREAVRARIAADPAVAARFAAFVETRMLMRNSADAPGDAVSDALVAAVRQREASLPAGAESAAAEQPQRQFSVLSGHAGPAPRSTRTERRRRPTTRWQLPMAAIVLLALGGVAGYFAAVRGADRNRSAQVAILAIPTAETVLTRALNTAASGTDVAWADSYGGSGRITMLSTHRLDDGTLCREFDVSRGEIAVTGASCRRAGAWRMEAAALKPMRTGAYAPAKGANLLDDYLQKLGSEGVLSPQEEQAAMARGWSAG